MPSEIVSIVYVELDALLDTRLPTLGKISPLAAVQCSQDARYYGRVCDDFEEICGVTHEAFKSAYAKRDAETLEASIITEIPFILNELVSKLERDTIDQPFADRVEVEVNIWPYRLEVETCEALELAVMARAGYMSKVTCVNIPYPKLTPQVVHHRYSGMIMYNFRDWMALHMEAFRHFRMPKVTILAPALFHDPKLIPGENAFVEDGMHAEVSPFQLSELAMVEWFSLSLLPAVNFSMAVLPEDHDTSDPQATPSNVQVPVFDDMEPKEI
jgi:hypothetical protein